MNNPAALWRCDAMRCDASQSADRHTKQTGSSGVGAAFRRRRRRQLNTNSNANSLNAAPLDGREAERGIVRDKQLVSGPISAIIISHLASCASASARLGARPHTSNSDNPPHLSSHSAGM